MTRGFPAAAGAAVIVSAVAFAPNAAPQAGSEPPAAPPPRTVEDILAVLDQYRPDPGLIARLRDNALKEPPATEDRAELARFYHARARAAGRVGMAARQLEDLRRAAEYADGTMRRTTGTESDNGLGEEARVLADLARIESGSGNFASAVRIREGLLKRVEQTGGMGGRRLAMMTALAGAAAAAGDVASAREYIGRADRVLASMQKNAKLWEDYRYTWTASLERNRAALHSAEGKYAAAEAAQRKALKEMDDGLPQQRRLVRAKRDVLPLGTWESIRNGDEIRLAQLVRAQGRLGEAEMAVRNALRRNLSFFGRYSPPTATALHALGRIVLDQGRYAEAALLAGASVETYEQSGSLAESNNVLNARRLLAAALVAQRRWRDALAIFETIGRDAARDPIMARIHGEGDVGWAWALIRDQKAARASAMLQTLLQKTRERLGEAAYETAELRGFLGMALVHAGERERALVEFRAAVPPLLEQMRVDQSAETAGIARAQRLQEILAEYIALLGGLHESGIRVPGFDPVGESFRVADAARGSSVQRAFTASAARASIRDPQLAELARREQDAQHRLGVLSELLSRLVAAPAEQQLPKVISDVRRDIGELRQQRRDLKSRIDSEFPDYSNLVDPRPATLAEAQRALRAEEALITVFSTDQRSFVWALTRQGNPAFAIVPLSQSQLAERVARLRRALDVGDVALARFPQFDTALAHDLYRALLAPVEASWRSARSLLVAPHGAIGQIPLALLVTDPPAGAKTPEVMFAEYRSTPWLIRRAAVTQLPSVSTLTALRRLPEPDANRRSFAGFGDPLFSKEQTASTPIATATRGVRLRNLAIQRVESSPPVQAAEGAEVAPPPAAAPVANSSGLAQLARLPDTAEEIREIAQTLGADPRQDVFLGAAASEQQLKKLDLSNRRIIAFATHGLVPGDLDGLTQPALALSSPDVVGGGDDGLLTMEEVLGLKLNADWVVLSACNTGSGDGAGSEAVSGLGRAFFYAGARALLVSNWPVESVSARLLTTELFRRQSGRTDVTRAEALRQSMLALIDGPGVVDVSSKRPLYSYAHPMFWAPFSLVGDGAGR